MMRSFPKWPLLLALGTLVLVACSGRDGADTPVITAKRTTEAVGTPLPVQATATAPTLTATPTPGRTAVPETTATAQIPTPDAALSAGDYTALIEAALEYLGAPFEIDDSFIRRMGQSGDTSFVPILVDMLFFRFETSRFTGDPIDSALTRLTRVGIESQSWRDWFIWLGRHPEIETPPGFAEWKSQLFQRIDPRISLFFYDGVKARIRLEEIVWGGVARDGIPDLNDAPVIPASQATYLNPDDRVFGVSINGEHRAYPLRILNAHEMANDVVGGEPIALAY